MNPSSNQNNPINRESKVVFQDDGQWRSLRGVITGEDAIFIVLERQNETIRIAKRVIIKIETPHSREGAAETGGLKDNER